MTVRESVGHVVGGTGIIWKAGRGAGKVNVEVGLSGISFPFSKLTEYSIYFILRIVQLTCNLSNEVICFASAQLIPLFDRA